MSKIRDILDKSREIIKPLLDDDNDNEAFNLSPGLVAKNKKRRSLYLRAKERNRRKNPSAALKRSKAAKKRWKLNRNKILAGIRKFTRSAKGKRAAKKRGAYNSIASKLGG